MTTRETLSLVPGATMTPTADGQRVVRGRSEVRLPPVSPGLGAALDALCAGGHSLDELTGIASREGVTQAALFHSLLGGLRKYEVLARTLHLGDSVIATLAPAAPRVSGAPLREGVRYGLSRFAFAHVVDGRWVLEMPLSGGAVWLSSWHGPALLGALAAPKNPEELAAAVPGLPVEVAVAFLRMLAEAGALTELGADGAPAEPDKLATWEFHDLLFHRQSRWGRRDGVYGGATYRFRGKLPDPGKKPPLEGEVFPLERPDLAEAEKRDPSLTAVLERRRSVRKHGSRPISRAELGELLYRAVGLRHAVFPERGEAEARPYPAGGALYETEVYLVINRCEDLEAGLYHYRVADHALCRLTGLTPAAGELLESAMACALLEAPPQVLFVLTARFARVAWKYETMAYAVMLKHVGVILQTLYLVATAMGLAPCGLGGGSAEIFARASGLDPFVEGSVGEFLLGTRPDTGS